ncbi:DUF4270 domain-containing protein [Chryseobacterium sp.]|nr:DUF4270 domain-containing protein [Chryseobacterium sp.]
MKNIKKLFNISLVVLGSILLLNCEPEADKLGEQLFLDGAAQGNEKLFDLVAYNINNGDKVRSDASRLQYAVLGAFNEPVFGKQKASYITQLRMQSYAPDFGTNPVLDSVVLVMKPVYASDSVTTTTDENFVYVDGNVPAKLVKNTYPVKKYGKTKINGKTIFNIRVHEVNDFLKSPADSVYSNTAYNYSSLLGSKEFDGTISSFKITKDSDNSELLNRDANIRIKLDNSFFKTKIIDHQGSVDLKDAAGFIRYFKGIRLSVDENDGYLFTFSPNAGEIVMYYKNDKTENGVTTRPQSSFKFTMGSENVHVGQYEYVRAGSALQNALATSNENTGDLKLFAQGMGGPGIGIKISPADVTVLKDLYQNKKAGIIGARIRLYSDTELWNNNYEKPSIFTVLQKNVNAFLPEMNVLSQANGYSLVKPYDLDKNPAYYDFTITKTLKDLIETEAPKHDYIINIGSFLLDPSSTTGELAGYNITSNAFTPNRIVLVGTDADNPKRAQLRVIYGTK